MKSKLGYVVLFGLLMIVALAYAQSSLSLTPGSTLASCPAPVTGSKALQICNVAGDPSNPDGAYVSANGGAYFLVSAVTQANGVTSWNKRTGAVSPASGDYSFSLITGQITGSQMAATTTCNVAFGVSGSSITATLTGCH